MSGYASQKYEEIVTCDEDPANVLRQAVPHINQEEWGLVKLVVQKLLYVREHVLKGGAGLAAPQIGLAHPIFIYTPDRTTENLKIVINPSYTPLGASVVEGHEACFSVPLRCTKLQRWKEINVRYQNLEGHTIEKNLGGFEAKVFQHEMDHLKGKLTIDHETADVLTFLDPQSFQDYMKQVHLEDEKRYTGK